MTTLAPLDQLHQECSHCGRGPTETALEEWYVGELTCNDCINRIIGADQRAREYESDCPPAWFDEADAGERWHEDY